MNNTTIEFTFENFIEKELAHNCGNYITQIMFQRNANLISTEVGKRKETESYINQEYTNNVSYYLRIMFTFHLENKNDFIRLIDEIFTKESGLTYTYINYNHVPYTNIDIQIKGFMVT